MVVGKVVAGGALCGVFMDWGRTAVFVLPALDIENSGGKMQKGFVSFTVVAPGSLSFLCQFNFMSSVLLCGWSLVVSLSL